MTLPLSIGRQLRLQLRYRIGYLRRLGGEVYRADWLQRGDRV